MLKALSRVNLSSELLSRLHLAFLFDFLLDDIRVFETATNAFVNISMRAFGRPRVSKAQSLLVIIMHYNYNSIGKCHMLCANTRYVFTVIDLTN